MQWKPDTNLINWAGGYGLDSSNIDVQLARLRFEISLPSSEGPWIAKSSYKMSYEEFTKSYESPEYLAEVYIYNYERGGFDSLKQRKGYAKSWYDYFSNGN